MSTSSTTALFQVLCNLCYEALKLVIKNKKGDLVHFTQLEQCFKSFFKACSSHCKKKAHTVFVITTVLGNIGVHYCAVSQSRPHRAAVSCPTCNIRRCNSCLSAVSNSDMCSQNVISSYDCIFRGSLAPCARGFKQRQPDAIIPALVSGLSIILDKIKVWMGITESAAFVMTTAW